MEQVTETDLAGLKELIEVLQEDVLVVIEWEGADDEA